jgi:hypothetical protein
MGEEGNPADAYELQITPHMKRLVFRDFIVSTKYPNNVVLVQGDYTDDNNAPTSAEQESADGHPSTAPRPKKDLGVCVISDLRFDKETDAFKLTVAPFAKQGDFYSGVPCNSSEFNIYMVTGGVDQSQRKEIDSSCVKTQFVCLMLEKFVANEQSGNASAAQNDVRPALDKTRTTWVCTPLMHSVAF